MVTLSTYVRFSWPRQLTTLTIRPHGAHALVDGLAQNCSDTSGLAMELLQSYAKPSMSIDAKWCSRVCKMVRRVRRKTHFLSGIVKINMKRHCFFFFFFFLRPQIRVETLIVRAYIWGKRIINFRRSSKRTNLPTTWTCRVHHIEIHMAPTPVLYRLERDRQAILHLGGHFQSIT